MNETSGNGAHGFGQRVEHIGSSAQTLWGEARGAVDDLTSTLDLRGRIDRRPYGTLLAAAGVGYLLGGGLFTGLTARLLRIGVRLAAIPIVKDELMAMAEAALQRMASVPEEVAEPSPEAGVPPTNS